jgi:hypothetical protein
MTKKIRIENADTSTYKVRAYVEDLIDGVWVRSPTPIELDHPTALTEQYLTSTRRVVVEEVAG